jgi:hypothetical protein
MLVRCMATVPTGGERYFAGPPVFGPGGSNLPARDTAARLAAEPVRLGRDRRPPVPGVSTFNARGDAVEPMLRAGLLGAFPVRSGAYPQLRPIMRQLPECAAAGVRQGRRLASGSNGVIPLLLRLAKPYYKTGTSYLVERREGIRNGWHDGLVAPICRCTGVTFQVGSPTG